jgi:hypothetical protein
MNARKRGADLPRLFSPARALPPISLGLAFAAYAVLRELDKTGCSAIWRPKDWP